MTHRNPSSPGVRPEQPSSAASDTAARDVLAGGGKMGALIRSIDWSKTPVGAQEHWPQSLRTALSLMLASQYPMVIWWGEELVQFYNDGYLPILGATKHPAAMGQRARECWKEIWDVIAPLADTVLAGGSTFIKDGLLSLDRNGFLEECYFDYAYSPVRDESGKVAGLFTACTEVTGRVLGERRLKVLGELGARAAVAKSAGLARPAQQPATPEARQHPAGLQPHRSGQDAGELRAHRPGSLHLRTGERL
jgi:hypothetical protein